MTLTFTCKPESPTPTPFLQDNRTEASSEDFPQREFEEFSQFEAII